MTIWSIDRKKLVRPVHSSLAEEMARAIESGELAVGARLPTHRSLAHELSLSVQTVSKAYDILKRQLLIDGQVGRGSYVTGAARSTDQPFSMEKADETLIDLSLSRAPYCPSHVEMMKKSLSKLAQTIDPEVFLATRPNVGLRSHRQAGARWLQNCNVNVNETSVILVNGVSHGLNIAFSALAQQGDVVVTTDIAHHLIVSLCSYMGLHLKGLSSDQEGILPDAFERACRDHQVKILFALPALADPQVRLMSEERRRALVAIAEKYDVVIIENDCWGPLSNTGQTPLVELAPDRTIYLTSFTKCTVPGLRTGYLVAPQKWHSALIARMIVSGWMATPLVAELASQWVDDGTAMTLTRWIVKDLAARNKVVEQEMNGLQWTGHARGLHFWLQLTPGWSIENLVAHARTMGVILAPTHPFMTNSQQTPNALRVAIGGVTDVTHLSKGLAHLKEFLSYPQDPPPLVL